jgi:hypothetical protein
VLFYICKYIELIFLAVWTFYLTSTAFVFFTKLSGNSGLDMQLKILMPICGVLSVFNLMYNNLFINLRFSCKIKCVTCGLCCFDCVNYTMCYCCLKDLCRDRCFKVPTLVKWVVKTIIFGYTIYLVQMYKATDEPTLVPADPTESNDIQALVLDVDSTIGNEIDIFLIIYLLQHPMFMLIRIPLFILWSLLTCCCDKGENYDEDEKFENKMISFDYIEYETNNHGGFENHQLGVQELAYNRNLSIIVNRQRQIN